MEWPVRVSDKSGAGRLGVKKALSPLYAMSHTVLEAHGQGLLRGKPSSYHYLWGSSHLSRW